MRLSFSSFPLCFAVLLSAAALSSFTQVASAAEPGSPSLGEPASILREAIAVNSDLYSSLESFVCQEQIDRYRGKTGSQRARRVDVINAKVSLENGSEHYSDVHGNKRAFRDLAELDGAWSEGEFGTLLKQTEQLLNSQYASFEGPDAAVSVPAFVFRIDVPADASPWDLTVAGQHYRIPFVAQVWIDRATKRIVKIERRSKDVPVDLQIAEIDWAVTLAPVALNGKEWLLPSSAEYQVGYRNTDRREWNEMKFFDYHRYTAEATLHFN